MVIAIIVVVVAEDTKKYPTTNFVVGYVLCAISAEAVLPTELVLPYPEAISESPQNL